MEYITEDESKPLLLVELYFGEHGNYCQKRPHPCIVVPNPGFVNTILKAVIENKKKTSA